VLFQLEQVFRSGRGDGRVLFQLEQVEVQIHLLVQLNNQYSKTTADIPFCNFHFSNYKIQFNEYTQ
jgi:hypothetical protein